MCGILGSIGSSPDREMFANALSGMEHRGPDALRQIDVRLGDRRVLLGFARLAIQDLSPAADQPLSRGTCTVLFNGEIYNADRVREELSGRGSTFITTGDAEVVAEAISVFGFLAAVKRFDGMFAIAAYDHVQQRLWLARDRFGIKPLFVHCSGGELAFASEVAALLDLIPSLTADVDIDYLARKSLLDPFIGFDPTRTAFRQVQALAPGTVATWHEGILSETPYYDLLEAANAPRDPIDLSETFARVVREHTVSDASLGFALSGGLDSSLILATAAAQGGDLVAFTLDFGPNSLEFDEDGRWAALLAQRLLSTSGRHEILPSPPPWTLEQIDACVRTLASPLYDDRVRVWDHIYSQVSRTGVRVVLNGQGADEFWYGYYPQIWSWFSQIYHRPHEADSYLDYFRTRWHESPLSGVLDPAHEARLDDLAREVFQTVDDQGSGNDTRRKVSAFLVRTCLGAILEFEDLMSMRSGVEVRVPFLDRELAEEAFRIPSAQHLPGDEPSGKALLKDALGGCLPSEIVHRRKQPLPKTTSGGAELLALFEEHLPQMREHPLVQALYLPEELKRLVDPGVEGSFYGNLDEARLQVLSTWRFGEVFHG
ncbi:asparagine synthase (glutamine-hydrolyzing) [Nocardioides piscis]|uniref:asparagine synthase (glutamine-hydrolyzing) n=1 Tax=Nocardioides piscis TaxID=2714938 RepID=A0A6G7YJ82_9ACTN|nr:asparagine synthase (glutamine-hydrolyzing) [Nocardioides piscis]QIK76792.1 asparagine synthase (glutamine-hydrolyzing) [Nocardioides piscis]